MNSSVAPNVLYWFANHSTSGSLSITSRCFAVAMSTAALILAVSARKMWDGGPLPA